MTSKGLASTSFYSHHSAWGAYASFIVGKYHHGAGFCTSNVQAPDTSFYLGYRQGKDAKPRLLPFITGQRSGLSAQNFTSDDGTTTARVEDDHFVLFTEPEIERTMDWATETWSVPLLTFKLITPFGEIPDISKASKSIQKFATCPVIFARLDFDNTGSAEEMVGIFALQGMLRPVSDSSEGKFLGAALGSRYGFATLPAAGVTEVLDWDVLSNVFVHQGFMRRLGNSGGLMFKIAAGQKASFDIVLATYQDGVRTSGNPMRFAYTECFRDLEDVLDFSFKNIQAYHHLAASRDNELHSLKINSDRKFLLAHATRSYLACTEYLVDKKDRPVFIVNEGEYQMINTLDLTVDQAFWEAKFTPWTLKNELDFYLANYSYSDQKGLTFTHDQGVADQFTPKHCSSYELPKLHGCFSFMSHEQLLNWVLTASIYIQRTEDKKWLAAKAKVLARLLKSLIGRDQNNDGIMDWDSDRCQGGSEITTYDSLDVSLGQARNNLYLAVKTWAGYVCLGRLFAILKDRHRAQLCEARAHLAAKTISSKFDASTASIPAVFEEQNTSQIIPAIEALIYPFWTGDGDAVSETGRFGDFIKTLNKHLHTVLDNGVCIDAVSGGWKLSSTSNNTWLSKIFINQYVAEHILDFQSPDWDKWDKIHAGWQQKACSLFAATDQVHSQTGKDLGSRLYPRLVSAILWV